MLSSSGADATVFVSEKCVSQCVYDTNIMVLGQTKHHNIGIIGVGHFAETDIELAKENYVCLSLSPGDIRGAMQFLLQKQATTETIESNITQEPGTSLTSVLVQWYCQHWLSVSTTT